MPGTQPPERQKQQQQRDSVEQTRYKIPFRLCGKKPSIAKRVLAIAAPVWVLAGAGTMFYGMCFNNPQLAIWAFEGMCASVMVALSIILGISLWRSA